MTERRRRLLLVSGFTLVTSSVGGFALATNVVQCCDAADDVGAHPGAADRGAADDVRATDHAAGDDVSAADGADNGGGADNDGSSGDDCASSGGPFGGVRRQRRM